RLSGGFSNDQGDTKPFVGQEHRRWSQDSHPTRSAFGDKHVAYGGNAGVFQDELVSDDEEQDGTAEDDEFDENGEQRRQSIESNGDQPKAEDGSDPLVFSMYGARKPIKVRSMFVDKLYRMVEDPSIQNLISWAKEGDMFYVHNCIQLSNNILPKFFKHNNWQSFVRQLNMYGFHKIYRYDREESNMNRKNPETQRWQFYHPQFQRDFPHLRKNIKRKSARSMNTAPATSRVVFEHGKGYFLQRNDRSRSINNTISGGIGGHDAAATSTTSHSVAEPREKGGNVAFNGDGAPQNSPYGRHAVPQSGPSAQASAHGYRQSPIIRSPKMMEHVSESRAPIRPSYHSPELQHQQHGGHPYHRTESGPEHAHGPSNSGHRYDQHRTPFLPPPPHPLQHPSSPQQAGADGRPGQAAGDRSHSYHSHMEGSAHENAHLGGGHVRSQSAPGIDRRKDSFQGRMSHAGSSPLSRDPDAGRSMRSDSQSMYPHPPIGEGLYSSQKQHGNANANPMSGPLPPIQRGPHGPHGSEQAMVGSPNSQNQLPPLNAVVNAVAATESSGRSPSSPHMAASMNSVAVIARPSLPTSQSNSSSHAEHGNSVATVSLPSPSSSTSAAFASSSVQLGSQQQRSGETPRSPPVHHKDHYHGARPHGVIPATSESGYTAQELENRLHSVEEAYQTLRQYTQKLQQAQAVQDHTIAWMRDRIEQIEGSYPRDGMTSPLTPQSQSGSSTGIQSAKRKAEYGSMSDESGMNHGAGYSSMARSTRMSKVHKEKSQMGAAAAVSVGGFEGHGVPHPESVHHLLHHHHHHPHSQQQQHPSGSSEAGAPFGHHSPRQQYHSQQQPAPQAGPRHQRLHSNS
ncbi:hypothetical protein BGW38_003384, partial [Lunasporangiospora selenospora]